MIIGRWSRRADRPLRLKAEWRFLVRLGFILTLFLVVLLFCCSSCRKPQTSGETKEDLRVLDVPLLPTAAKAVEDFGTGIDISKLSYASEITPPAEWKVTSEGKLHGVRNVFLENRTNGIGVSLALRPNGYRSLNISRGPSTSGKVDAALTSYKTNLGISIGATLADVTAKHGKSPLHTFPKSDGYAFVRYKGNPGGSYLSLLILGFKDSVLDSMASAYYDPAEVERWDSLNKK
jgi:hypothetical protein